MRTGVFSDERVALATNARFISVWENRRPEVKFPDGRALRPEKILEGPCSLPIGAGGTNVISVFATPEGDVLTAVPGFLDVERFFDEMRVAWEVDQAVRDGAGQVIKDYWKPFARIHESAARRWGGVGPGLAHHELARRGLLALGCTFQATYCDSLYRDQE